jgi:hypothetical protein
MAHTACLVMNVSSVSGHDKRLAAKVGKSTYLACLPCQLTCLAGPPSTSACYKQCFVELDFWQTNMT